MYNIHEILANAMNRNDYGAITLGQLIDTLEKAVPNMVIPHGFGAGSSWRGVYAFVAFSPERDTTVAAMLQHAKDAVGETYPGYKGGEFTMTRETPCFIDCYGESSDDAAITPERLTEMLRGVKVAEYVPSNTPKRPSLIEAYQGDHVLLNSNQWEKFKEYVCILESIAAKACT